MRKAITLGILKLTQYAFSFQYLITNKYVFVTACVIFGLLVRCILLFGLFDFRLFHQFSLLFFIPLLTLQILCVSRKTSEQLNYIHSMHSVTYLASIHLIPLEFRHFANDKLNFICTERFFDLKFFAEFNDAKKNEKQQKRNKIRRNAYIANRLAFTLCRLKV